MKPTIKVVTVRGHDYLENSNGFRMNLTYQKQFKERVLRREKERLTVAADTSMDIRGQVWYYKRDLTSEEWKEMEELANFNPFRQTPKDEFLETDF